MIAEADRLARVRRREPSPLFGARLAPHPAHRSDEFGSAPVPARAAVGNLLATPAPADLLRGPSAPFRSSIPVLDRDLTGALKRLKLVFNKEIRPMVLRHKFAMSPGQQRRLKRRRARKKARQREQRRDALESTDTA